MQDLYNNIDGGATTPKSSGFNWGNLGTSVLTTGGSILASIEGRKAQEAQANALRAKGLSEIEVAKLMLEGKRLDLETAKAGAGAKSGSKTLYIGLGVGAVVILGVVIFAVTRKK